MSLTIYKSSAGSGKTFTLVKEYLKIVLKNPFDYRHILALTFTNKATEEMKVRILETLEATSLGEGDMFSTLVEELKLEEKVIKAQAQQTLDLILHDYSRFEVSTIDSFFARVIRSFAKEMQLPMRYDMEMDTDVAIDQATQFLFANIHENKELASWLLKYSFSRMDDDKGWRIEEQMKNLGKTIFEEDVFEWLENGGAQLNELNAFISACQQFNKNFEDTLQKKAQAFKDLLSNNGLTVKDLSNYSSTWIYKRIDEKNYIDISSTFLKTVEKGEWQKKTGTSVKIVIGINDDLTKIAAGALAFYEENITEYYTYKAFLYHVYAYGVLGNLSNGVKQYRDDKNLLLISDVNAIITSTIGNDDAPFLYEKLGNFYKHIFIDEFQDTSNFQWNNLKPLVYNSLGHGEKVLIVGDVKQSIYRFRGGNLNLLLKEVKKEFSKLYFKQIEENVLGSNWRSKTEIVEYNNMFFNKLSNLIYQDFGESINADLVDLAYKDLYQKPESKGEGYVEVQFFNEIKASKDKEESKWKDQAKEQVLATLKQLKEDNYSLNDIMLLVFRNRDANEIADLLVKENIPFISSHSLLASSSLKVKFLVQIMYYLQRPDDAIAHSAMLYLYHEIKGKKIWNHHWIFSDFEREQSILKDLFPPEFFERKADLQRLSIYELVEELCYIFKLNINNDSYLQFFANICLKQTAKGIVTIYDFLLFWEEKKDKLYIDTPENLDAVSIMTIHKAKGLEKPVVILPFMISSNIPNTLFWSKHLPEAFSHFGYLPLPYNKYLEKSLFAEAYFREKLSETLDELNRVYVAFTRPKDRLYIFSKTISKSSGDGGFSGINKWIHETLLSVPEFNEAYNQAEGVFRLGKAIPKVQDKIQQESTYALTGESRPYNSFINIRSEAKEHFLLFDSDVEENISQGIKAHAVLERMHKRNDLERVLAMLLSEGLLVPEDLNYLRNIIEELFLNPLFASWFEDETWQVLAERELLEGNKKIHKPDRVLIKENKAIVIDYKKLVEDEKYLAQVRRYGRLLSSMGFSEVKKYLVYVDTGVIKEVV